MKTSAVLEAPVVARQGFRLGGCYCLAEWGLFFGCSDNGGGGEQCWGSDGGWWIAFLWWRLGFAVLNEEVVGRRSWVFWCLRMISG